MTPILFPTPLKHRNFDVVREFFIDLVSFAPPGKIIALLGPTQAGKSLICEKLVASLKISHRPKALNEMPVVHIVLGTGNDGRVSPKLIGMKLLKAVNHPIYGHVGDMDEVSHYVPSRWNTESNMILAVENAYESRKTVCSIMDEAHHATYTKDPKVRKGVLDAVKCLSAINRTLVLIGGYELAYSGFFDSAHFAGRVVCVELAPYTTHNSDLEEWRRILSFLSSKIQLEPKTLLLDKAELLLVATNGVFGLLEKLLWLAKAMSRGRPITHKTLVAAFPSQSEHDVIREDINRGQKALKKYEVLVPPGLRPEEGVERSIKRKTKPFKCKPNRRQPAYPKMGHE